MRNDRLRERVKLENNRTAILIGLGFSACLTLIILRGLFFAPGFVAYSDATFSHDMVLNRDMFTNSWSQFAGWDSSRLAFNLPFIYPLIRLFSNTGIFTKALYFILFTLMGTVSFSVAFLWLRERGRALLPSYVGASVCALVYMLSTYVVIGMTHYNGLFSYALLPITFYAARAAFRQGSHYPRAALKYGIILGLVLMLATSMYYIFGLHLVVLVITALGQLVPRLVRERRGAKGYLVYSFCLSGMTVVCFGLLWAWYILPFLISHSMGFTEFRHVIIDAADVKYYAQEGSFLNVVRMYGFITDGLYDCSGALKVTWQISTVVVPALALLGAALRPRSRDTVVFFLVAVAGIFLSMGPNGPLDGLYLWLFSHFDLPFVKGGLYAPCRALPLVILPYAFLSAYASASVFERLRLLKPPWRKIMPVTMVVLLCALICINTFPLMSGDLRGTMNPMQVPQPYTDANNFFKGDNRAYRVAWLPRSDMVEWNPHADSASDWYSLHVVYVPPLLSSEPITSLEGIGGTTRPVERCRLEQYIHYLLSNDKDFSLGTLLAMENAGYLLYHDDTLDRADFQDLLTSLNERDDLDQVYNSDYVYIFQNKDYGTYLHTEGKSTLVVGGLDSLGIASRMQLVVPDERSFIFLEQSASTSGQMNTFLECSDSILFYANKDLDDLMLGSLDASYYHPALECWNNDYQSPWTRDFFYSLKWHNYILTYGADSTWDFDLNLGMMRTYESDASLTFKVNTDQESYEIWVRNYVSDGGSALEAYVDGELKGNISGYSSRLAGFEWQRIGQTEFSQGQHDIVLKTTDSGFNAVNAIAVVPATVLQQHQNRMLGWIRSSDIKLIYLTEYSKMTPSGSHSSVEIPEDISAWQADNESLLVSTDATEFIEGESSLKVDGNGSAELSCAIQNLAPAECCASGCDVRMSLRFSSLPPEVQKISLSIISSGIRKQWDIDRAELREGMWQDFSFSLDAPDSEATCGVSSDTPYLSMAVTAPDGCEYSYNVDGLTVVNLTKAAEFTTVGSQKHTVAVKVDPHTDNASVSISIDGAATDFPVNQSGWVYSTFYGTRMSNHQIVVGGQGVTIGDVAIFPSEGGAQDPASILDDDAAGAVTGYRIVSPTKIVVTVEASEPCILSFGESYHGSWIATDGQRKLSKVALNSTTNGFLIEEAGTHEIVLTFAIDKYLTAGKVISGLTGIALLAILVLVHRREKRDSSPRDPNECSR